MIGHKNNSKEQQFYLKIILILKKDQSQKLCENSHLMMIFVKKTFGFLHRPTESFITRITDYTL